MNQIDWDKLLEWLKEDVKGYNNHDIIWAYGHIERKIQSGSFAIKEESLNSELTYNDLFQIECLVKEHGVDHIVSTVMRIGYDLFMKEDTE